MSSPATDEQITALDDKLLNYPQSTSAEAGASPDMKRFLYAQQQLPSATWWSYQLLVAELLAILPE